MIALVGYTGFVGSNILMGSAGKINSVYNTKNISEAFGTKPDILIFAGLRAEKYLANSAPEKDMNLIQEAQDNITKIAPKKLILISTIDVFNNPVNVTEHSPISTENLHPYGLNRYRFEQWARNNYPNSTIIRLPGLFGKNIKKNFIYDYLNVIPFMLKENKFEELSAIDSDLKKFYVNQNNGFYKVNVSDNDKTLLKEKFKELGFSALNFTDSRNVYQFYDLSGLWDDINNCVNSGIELWHPATEPVSASEVYEYLTGTTFVNELKGAPVRYDFKTVYADLFNGEKGYIYNKETVLKRIKRFVKEYESVNL